jgi:hypothetical protein
VRVIEPSGVGEVDADAGVNVSLVVMSSSDFLTCLKCTHWHIKLYMSKRNLKSHEHIHV